MNAIGKVLQLGASFIAKAAAEQDAEARQTQLMSALNDIKKTLDSMQEQEDELSGIDRIQSSLDGIEVWQQRCPDAVQNNDQANIRTLINEFDTNALTYVKNILNVMAGQGTGPGVPPLLKPWHQQSYAKMYPANGPYTFTLRNYLDDYDSVVSWGISMAGYALMCYIFARRELADSNMSPSDIEKEADAIMEEFKTQATDVLGVAYDQFPSFVKFFKKSYTDVGSNLTYWFRMWRPGSHIKNYVAWKKEMAPDCPDLDCWAITPLDCDSDEGIYPELEFRFDATNHPLYGPATLISRIEGATVHVFDGTYAGLTTSTVASDWPKNVTFAPATFNILPLSVDDMDGSKAPGFLPLLTNPLSKDLLRWPTLPRGLISGYWILRDDGLQQTSWVETPSTASDAPGEPSRAPGPNPE